MIAYISPLVPKKTGIALYSHHLIRALQPVLADKNIALDVFDDDVLETNAHQSDYVAQELLPLLFEKGRREKYQQFIYHLGNNPSFHLSILRLLRQQPGIVVLHDTVLYFLIAGEGLGGLWKALDNQDIDVTLDCIDHILANCPDGNILRYSSPEKHPFLQNILAHASSVVVHSKMAKSLVFDAGYKGAIVQVPLIDYQQATTFDAQFIENKAVLNLLNQKSSHHLFIIGLFGFSGETKRSRSIFQAMSELDDKIKSRLRLMIVGNDLYQKDISALGLSELVMNTGYVSDGDYDQCMALCDLVINLRFPSMGETSAVQIQAMSAKKATIVSDYGWFSELPSSAVYKIPVGNTEVTALKVAIITLIDNSEYRLSIAHEAKQYVNQYHSVDTVAEQWLDILLT
jgi:glycosyltransferase involved in cell wall biosynthesis